MVTLPIGIKAINKTALNGVSIIHVKLIDHIIKQTDNRYEMKTPIAIFATYQKLLTI